MAEESDEGGECSGITVFDSLDFTMDLSVLKQFNNLMLEAIPDREVVSVGAGENYFDTSSKTIKADSMLEFL